jgi:hypothetical protein
LTQGYWRTHGTDACHAGNNGDEWPDEIRDNGMTIGNVHYSADDLCAILNEPVEGNCLVSLAHQLIAAELNIANGAPHDCIDPTMAQVSQLIGDLVIPPIGNGWLFCNISGYIQALTDYNEGNSGCASHCNNRSDPVPGIQDNPCVTGSPTPTPTPEY